MNIAKESRQFGKKDSKIIISKNGQTRVYRISTSFILLSFLFLTMFFTGYVGATAYLAFREDLVASSMIRQTRMRHEYEDRIAALRAEVDRITSRQLLDQQALEAKVHDLMRQQELLSGRSGMLDGLLEKARKNGIKLPPSSLNGQKKASLSDPSTIDPVTTGSVKKFASAASSGGFGDLLRGSTINGNTGKPIQITSPQNDIALAGNNSILDQTNSLFGNINEQIDEIEISQRNSLLALQNTIKDRSEAIAGIYRELKIGLPGAFKSGIGGPFLANPDLGFDDLTDSLNNSIQTYEKLKKKASKLPISNPVPGASISSSFGNRVDPFRKTTAFHAGLDFRARHGMPVRSSGAGKVTHSGRKGGYGLMVEIAHGNGVTTRYAHLSRILVKKGQWVGSGKVVGKVGSTGRSTGPHLHYEVRRSNKAVNPVRYLRAGRKLRKML